MAEINTYPLQHQLLPSKSVQTVVCRQKQNKANWIQRLFSIVTIFQISIQMPHLLHYSCVSLSVNFSHTLFVIPTKLHTKIQSHCDTV